MIQQSSVCHPSDGFFTFFTRSSYWALQRGSSWTSKSLTIFA